MNAPRLTAKPGLPEWAETIRRKYVGGEASVFLLYGNVFDEILDGGVWRSLRDFLIGSLLGGNKERVLVYDPADGLLVAKGAPLDEDSGLEALERVLFDQDRVA